MKKSLFIILGIFVSIFLTGCGFLMGGSSSGKTSSQKVSSVDIIELTADNIILDEDAETETGIFSLSNLKGKIKEDSKIFVVQVSTRDDILDKGDVESGLLKSEVYPSVNGNSSFRSAGVPVNESDFTVNEVPEFVKEFNRKPRPVLSEDFIPSYKSSIRHNDEENEPEIGNTEVFFTPMDNSNNPENFDDYSESILKYISKHAYIYYLPNISWHKNEDGEEDLGIDYFSDEEFEKLGKKFDDIYEAEINLLGSNEITFTKLKSRIIETSPKITILVNDIYCDSKENQTGGTFGYFSPNDLYMNTADMYDYNVNDIVNSNQCEIIYLDSVLYKKYPTTAISTLAHEFNHLLNSVNKEINNYHKNSSGVYVTDRCNTWFTEMLSVVSEDILFKNYLKEGSESCSVYKNRLPYFCGSYNLGFTAWPESESALPYYGNAFAYGTFLMRNYGGVQLLNEIATNPYVNVDAINEALKTLDVKSPFNNMKTATFEDTVKDFALSCINYDVTLSSGLKTLNKDVNERLGIYKYTADAINLNSYNAIKINKKTDNAGIYFFESGEQAQLGPTGSIIQYAGTAKDINEISVTLPEYDGLYMYLVVQNY